MSDLVSRLATHWTTPDAIAIQTREGEISYAAFARQIDCAAAALRDMGVGTGDRVALALPKSLAGFVLFLGVLRNGSVAVAMNPTLPPDTLARMVQASDPRLLIHDVDQEPPPGVTCPVASLGANGRGSWPVAVQAADPTQAPQVTLDDQAPALILFTSGTTGTPKGVLHSVGGLSHNAQALSQTWAMSPQDVVLHVLPTVHAHGLLILPLPTLMAGGRILWMDGFDPRAVLAAMRQATCFMGVPFHYRQLLDSRGFDPADLAGMRLFVSGSAPLSVALEQEFANRTGHHIAQRYGMTESLIITANQPGAAREGSVGQALPGLDLRIVDPDTRARLPTGEVGEIEIAGPSVFSTYVNAPQAMAQAFGPSGGFRTGDLAAVDADGFVWLRGRARDLIIYCGMNVYPGDVEAALEQLPQVVEACVYGIPQDQTGEAVMAAVVLQPGASADPAQLRRALIGRLAPYQLPKRVRVAEQIPRNTMGKPDRNALRAAESEGVQPKT